jgi:polysaccharide export outer membrane protein
VPAVPSVEDGFEIVEEVATGMDDLPARAMTLYPGDIVTLEWASLEVRAIEGLTVDERGLLHVPLAGDVEVGGLTLSDAETRVEAAIQRLDRAARAALILTEPRGQQASVIGAVVDQGRVVVTPGMRVADLLAAVGGPSLSDEDGVALVLADLGAARLVREGQPLPISLSLALLGDPRHNVRVRPGDHLYVPPQLGSLVSVLGEVGTARVFAHRPGLRLTQALAMAGGLTRDANGGDIRIVRGLSSSPRVYHASVAHVVEGWVPDPVLAPGDVVLVGSSALADFRDGLGAVTPFFSLATTAILLATAWVQ